MKYPVITHEIAAMLNVLITPQDQYAETNMYVLSAKTHEDVCIQLAKLGIVSVMKVQLTDARENNYIVRGLFRK